LADGVDELVVLPVLPWTAAAVGLALVVGVNVPPGGPREGDRRAGPSPVATPLGAALAALIAVVVVLVARLGSDSELDNPVPAAVVGLGWPLLFLAPALAGPLTRRFRPHDEGADDVRLAVPGALAVVAFLTVPLNPTSTTAVGTAVAAYALAVATASVAAGRRTVAARAEVLGLLARWSGLGPALTRWRPPVGAAAVLAVVLGGAWFERFERTTAWQEAVTTRLELGIGLGLAVLLAAALALALARCTRTAPGTAAAVLLPLAAAAVVAGAARRALISAQVLVTDVVDPDPLGVIGGQALSVGLVAVGGALAAAVLARRSGPGAARLPGLAVVLAATAVSAAITLQV
jgi:hypothetical protein